MICEYIINEQVRWIKNGKMGCAYAALLVNQRNLIGWKFEVVNDINNFDFKIAQDTYLSSLIFPYENLESVKNWALKNGFFIENIDELHEGLRIEIENKKAWVLYFGPDSHLKTRQSPFPMLMFTVKIPKIYHVKVLLKGILSVAHTSLEYISDKQNDKLWEQSHDMSKKILGFSPTRIDAFATFLKKKD